jgi:DnaK suppressor protein
VPAENAPDIAGVLAAERTQTLTRIAALTGEFDGIVLASTDANIDDEHDPEGTTIAFERAQVSAMLSQARRHLADLDRAALRLDNGNYGVCECCGGSISPARLAALPVAHSCIDCARLST